MKNFICVLTVSLLVSGCGSQKVEEQSGQPQVKVVTTAPQNHLEQGVRLLQQANPKAAIESFDAAIKENPRDAQGYLVLGQTYLRMGNLPRAIDTLNAATYVAPDHGEAYYLLAVSYGLSGKPDLARAYAQKSLDIFRRNKDEANFKRAIGLLQGLSQPAE